MPATFARLTSGSGFPRSQDNLRRSRFRATTSNYPRHLPSVRPSILRPRLTGSRTSYSIVHARFAPVRVPRWSSPRQGLSLRFTLPRPRRRALRLALDARERCVSPTSATDSRHEHLPNRPILEVLLRACALENTTDGAKAPAVDSSGCALDGASPASASSRTSFTSMRRRDERRSFLVGASDRMAPSSGAPSPRRCRPRARSANHAF